MVSVCLPSDALLQHLPSYLGFSYLGWGVSPHRCPSWPWMWSSSAYYDKLLKVNHKREIFKLVFNTAAATAKSLQLCPTLCDPIDGSPSGFLISGILQARTLEWVAIFFSNARKWKVKVKSLSRVWLLATPWTAAHQAPPSMGFSRQEYWSGVPLPSLN